MYDTDLPVRAIERIPHCSRCGRATLVPVPEGEEQAVEARQRSEEDPSPA